MRPSTLQKANVTVVVPAHQAEAFVIDTLSTIARQTRLPREVIVVDDGSTDSTCAAVEAFAGTHPELSVTLLREEHRGPGAARNTAIQNATSDWIAFLDSDDLWQPDKLESIFGAIAANPETNFVYHNLMARLLTGEERIGYHGEGLSSGESIPKQLFKRNFFCTSAVVCRRDLILRWGGFDESLTSSQDYDLWLRMSKDLVPVFVEATLGTYVSRRGNISTSRFWKRLVNLLRIKHRHRAKGGLPLYAYTVLYTIAYHIGSPIRDRAKTMLRRVREPRQ